MKVFMSVLVLLVLSAGAYAACHCCVTEPLGWAVGDSGKTAERFRIYKANNVDMLRQGFEWRWVQNENGEWDAKVFLDYLKLAKEYGFRLKTGAGAISGPAGWYMKQHPNACLKDQNGVVSPNTMSYCYSDLHKVIDEKQRKMVSLLKEAGVWDAVDYVCPDFGPASEPIYPAVWTMGGYEAYGPQCFWGYDEDSQKNWRQAMKKKYGTIAKANKAWNTDFASWDAAKILQPGEKPGAYWNDYLTWYRDVKRDFVRWEISNFKKIVPDKQIMVLIPGTSYTEEDWQEAVKTGRGNDSIMIMCDSMWLMEEALRHGCVLQYTGCENEAEVVRLRAWLDSHGHKDAVLWGENCGNFPCADKPLRLADICVQNRLFGLDYTHSWYAFVPKGQTEVPDGRFDMLTEKGAEYEPHPRIMPQLSTAFGIIRDFNEAIGR